MADETIKINLDELTIGDMRELKRILHERCGMGWRDAQRALAEGDPDAVAAMTYIAKRKTDPTVTLEDIDALNLSVLTSPPEDPTNAAGSQS